MIWPSLISCAMPRPATIRIKVAMIGCMPTLATRKPFHSPHSVAAPSEQRMASPIGLWLTRTGTPS